MGELEAAEQTELQTSSRFQEVGADDERIAEEAGESNTGFKALAARRIEHGSQSHMMAFQVCVEHQILGTSGQQHFDWLTMCVHGQIVLLRKVFNVPRGDARVQKLAEGILSRCSESASTMGMSVLCVFLASITDLDG